MNECVVVGCHSDSTETVSKATHQEVWSYQVCSTHADEVRAGAAIDDNADGHTIALGPAPRTALGAVDDPALSPDPELRSGQLGLDPTAPQPGDGPSPKAPGAGEV